MKDLPKVERSSDTVHGIPAGVKLTPMLQQYAAAKEQHPDALLFFRLGDFYEMFFDDAELAGRILDLTVTSRDKGSSVPAPMSGFPHHQLAGYLAKALAAGYKVAVCDQLEDATLARGIVRRGITQVVTPGVIFDTESLEARSNNFLVALAADATAQRFALAALDISTGDFKVTELFGVGALRTELSRLEPKELLLGPEAAPIEAALHGRLGRLAISRLEASFFDPQAARRHLASFVDREGAPAAEAMAAFGFGAPEPVWAVAGAALAYVIHTQQRVPEHVRCVQPYRAHESLVLDETAKANLELFKTVIEGRKKGALLGVLDRARTAMGGRKLRQWLAFPLINPEQIHARLDAVEGLVRAPLVRGQLSEALAGLYDLERLNARVAAERAGPRQLDGLRATLAAVPTLVAQLEAQPALADVVRRLDAVPELVALLNRGLADEQPAQLREGGVIRAGYDAQLDELNDVARNGRAWIASLEARERERTGITSLKVRFNKVFGYYIEISRANLHLVPEDYERKQTLANAERYITEELKELEDKVLNAEARRATLEQQLFTDLRTQAAAHAARIAQTAAALADLDALCALAEVAHQHDYCRPTVDDGDVIEIVEGRHPVVEQAVGREHFVPNDLRLDRESQSLIVLTGPNMAGKSTIMRQAALTVLLAQMGSFVPAKSAHIGVVDRIFTRVGAADDLASGRSTFMVEMHETATILQEATPRSLLILDEIGRGTSTYDGLSIAWAVAEYIHDVLGAKGLFATHYHELTDLEQVKPRVRNFTIAVREWQDEVVFLRQLVPGGANRSYGIQVARLAGLPEAVLTRAQAVLGALQEIEQDALGQPRLADPKDTERMSEHGLQLSLFAPPALPNSPSAVELELKGVDLNHLSPMQALSFLQSLQKRLR